MTDEGPADRAARRRLLLLLYAAYASMHLNRQIVAILAGSLRADLGLGDSQLGTLTGSAFAIVFAILGLHFGAVADRRDRLFMVRCGALLWSAAAAAAALASSFTTLLLARATVAVGEAVATAAAIALMAELSPRPRLGRTSGAFFASAYAGAGLAAIVGGALLSWQPPLAGIAGWRSAMLAAAAPGLLIALLLRDPRGGAPRKRSAAPRASRWAGIGFAASATAVVGLQECLPPALGVPAAVALAIATGALWIAAVRRRTPSAFAATFARREYRLWLLAFAAVLFVDYAAGFWLIPIAERRFAIDPAALGRDLGGLLIGGGFAGALAGGWVADAWARTQANADVWTALGAFLLEVIAIWIALRQSGFAGYLWAYAGFCIASGGWTGVAAAIGLRLVPEEHRGIGAAGYFFITTVFGLGLGPFLVGLGSDALGSVGTALRIGTLVAIVAVAAFVRLGRTLPHMTRGVPSHRSAE